MSVYLLTSNYVIFSDEDLAENENSQEKSNEDIEENNTFFISTQPSNEPEKIREPSEEPSDSENDEKDQGNLLRDIDNKTVRKYLGHLNLFTYSSIPNITRVP